MAAGILDLVGVTRAAEILGQWFAKAALGRGEHTVAVLGNSNDSGPFTF